MENAGNRKFKMAFCPNRKVAKKQWRVKYGNQEGPAGPRAQAGSKNCDPLWRVEWGNGQRGVALRELNRRDRRERGFGGASGGLQEFASAGR